MEEKDNIIIDEKGRKIVIINNILFRGKRQIDWKDVEKYLKRYVGRFYEIIETKDIIYLGTDLPDEFTGSKYTSKLKGTLSKAKANAAQGIPELVKIATKKRFKENLTDKHKKDAKYGWYRFDSRFALPIYNDEGGVERYNIFCAELIVRHSVDNKLYLYDIININKEKSLVLE